MIRAILCLQFLWNVVNAQDYYYQPHNVTRTTPSGLAAYRSALTLDWLAAEDSRQRELASAFETDAPPARYISSDCGSYPKPAPGKVARLMLDLLKNLEGDDGFLIPDLVQALVRSKLLVDTLTLEDEPDFEALVKTPGLMVGEPHSTLPRVVAAVWMLVTDPVTTRKYGWCLVKQMNKYLHVAKPRDIAKQMKALEVIVARARFVIEEFIQNVTPINMYQQKPKLKNTPKLASNTSKKRRLEKRPPDRRMEPEHHVAAVQASSSSPLEAEAVRTADVIDKSFLALESGAGYRTLNKFLMAVVFVL